MTFVRALVATIVLPSVVVAASAAGVAAQPSHPAAGAGRPMPPATNTTRGVVRLVDATRLVITDRHGGSERAFVLNASTARQGRIAPGATVVVRYRREKGLNIATAVVSDSAAVAPRDAGQSWSRLGRAAASERS